MLSAPVGQHVSGHRKQGLDRLAGRWQPIRALFQPNAVLMNILHALASTDLVAVAQGCGLADSAWAADEEDFERLVEASLSTAAPSLIAVRIDGQAAVATTHRDSVHIRERFMHGIGVRQ